MLKLNDFFCGCGGIGLGFKRAGWEIQGSWDWAKFAIQTYNENVKDHAKVADIREMSWTDLSGADCWTFGFPCTDLSVANMKGKDRPKLAGENSGLFYQVMRLLDETRESAPDNLPGYLMAENVEDLLDVMDVLQEEYRIRGYVLYYKLYNAKRWGTAQNRPRYFAIGIREDLHNGPFNFPEDPALPIPRLIDFLDEHVEERYFYTDEYVSANYTELPDREFLPGQLNQVGELQGNGWLDYMRRVYDPRGIAPTLHTCQGGHRQAKIVDPKTGRIRRLTPSEYGRLQGFPVGSDDWTTVVSPAQQYIQFGNAVFTGLSEAMAGAIQKYHANGRAERGMWEKLQETQKALDDRIVSERMLDVGSIHYKINMTLALRVELAEYANETRCFKQWSDKEPAGEERRLEEAVDALHFYLHMANMLTVNLQEAAETGILELPIETQETRGKTISLHLNRAMDSIRNQMTIVGLLHSLGHFLAVVRADGFTLQDMESAYYRKNQINHERQDQGY